VALPQRRHSGIESTSGPSTTSAFSTTDYRVYRLGGVPERFGTDITVNQNYIDTTSRAGGGGVFHLDTDGFNGFHFTNTITQAAGTSPGTGLFVDGNHNVDRAARNPLIKGN
jgi:hypothetical protein